MTTDTSERGRERPICVALTGATCDPAAPGMAAERLVPFGGVGYVCGNPADYDREYCVDLVQLGDNEGFKRWPADTVFGMTYPPPG